MRIALEKGTLLNLALKSKDKMAEDKRNIDEALQLIADKIEFTLGEPQVRHKGNKADLLINLEWNINDYEEILDKIELFYDFGSLRPYGPTNSFLIYSFDFKGIYGEELWSYFKGRKLFFNISAGKWKTTYEIIESNLSLSTVRLHYQTVLTIADIPLDSLKEITNIDTKIVVGKQKKWPVRILKICWLMAVE